MATRGYDTAEFVVEDFDLLLESFLPHQQFAKFLKEERPEALPYLTIVRKIKHLFCKQAELDAKLDEGVQIK